MKTVNFLFSHAAKKEFVAWAKATLDGELDWESISRTHWRLSIQPTEQNQSRADNKILRMGRNIPLAYDFEPAELDDFIAEVHPLHINVASRGAMLYLSFGGLDRQYYAAKTAVYEALLGIQMSALYAFIEDPDERRGETLKQNRVALERLALHT